LMHDYSRASMLLHQRAIAQREVRFRVLTRGEAAADDDLLARLDFFQLGRPQRKFNAPLGVLGWIERQPSALAIGLHGHLARDPNELALVFVDRARVVVCIFLPGLLGRDVGIPTGKVVEQAAARTEHDRGCDSYLENPPDPRTALPGLHCRRVLPALARLR